MRSNGEEIHIFIPRINVRVSEEISAMFQIVLGFALKKNSVKTQAFHTIFFHNFRRDKVDA